MIEKSVVVPIEIMRMILEEYFKEKDTHSRPLIEELDNQRVLVDFEIFIGILKGHLIDKNGPRMRELMLNYFISHGVDKDISLMILNYSDEETEVAFRNYIEAMEYFLTKGKGDLSVFTK